MASIRELEPAQFPRILPLFEGRKEYVPALAVAAGNFPGRIFVDDADEPRSALAWALTRWAYIDGDPGNRAFLESLARLVADEIYPMTRQLGSNWFELYTSDLPAWSAEIEKDLRPLAPERHLESVYALDVDLYRQLRVEPIPPSGHAIRMREIPIVSGGLPADAPIPPSFRSKTAFGFELVEDDEVIAVCRSNGFAHRDEFMVDVETVSEAARGRGYATLVATALIDHALASGLSPLWETAEFNVPSQKLAAKLGFYPIETYPVYGMEIP